MTAIVRSMNEIREMGKNNNDDDDDCRLTEVVVDSDNNLEPCYGEYRYVNNKYIATERVKNAAYYFITKIFSSPVLFENNMKRQCSRPFVCRHIHDEYATRAVSKAYGAKRIKGINYR